MDMTNEILGVDYKGPGPAHVFIKNQKWEIAPVAHTADTMDKVMAAVDEYEQAIQKVMQGKMGAGEKYRISTTATRKILEATLVKFSWKKAANDPNIGPGLLGRAAEELISFLDVGGRDGMQLLQTRLDMASKISRRTTRS